MVGGKNHLNSINIFININDIVSIKWKHEHLENIKEPLELKNMAAEIKNSIKELFYVSKELEWEKKLENIVKQLLKKSNF